jgi:hypothetical protein
VQYKSSISLTTPWKVIPVWVVQSVQDPASAVLQYRVKPLVALKANAPPTVAITARLINKTFTLFIIVGAFLSKKLNFDLLPTLLMWFSAFPLVHPTFCCGERYSKK